MLDVLLVGAEELENLGTRYLAAVLRQAGYSVQLAAFSTEADGPAVVDLARRASPRLVGLSLIFEYRAPEFLRLAADLRRRVCRFVFGSPGTYEVARERTTQAWFRLLLSERFGRDGPTGDRRRLGSEVRRINGVCLSLWDEMVRFAGRGRITDADEVNMRAAGWCARLSLACLQAA